MKSMKSQQSGFTLVEIAIVLVIIGLLLGGILKGQELINSAKVKNLAQDFKTVPLFIYGYQDRFKALPGDDKNAITNLGSANAALANGTGDGVINGAWNATAAATESVQFWLAVRMANFAPGSTDFSTTASLPKNVDGGPIGITSNTTTGATPNAPVANMTGTYAFCSGSLLGKYAKQLDTTLDDGNTATGSVRVIDNPPVPQTAAATALANSAVDDATTYTVCMTF